MEELKHIPFREHKAIWDKVEIFGEKNEQQLLAGLAKPCAPPAPVEIFRKLFSPPKRYLPEAKSYLGQLPPGPARLLAYAAIIGGMMDPAKLGDESVESGRTWMAECANSDVIRQSLAMPYVWQNLPKALEIGRAAFS